MPLPILDDLLDRTVIMGYDRIGYALRKPLWDSSDTDVSMTGKTCLITGANAGIGQAAAERLADLGATVHLLCRDAERGLEARNRIIEKTGNRQVHLELVDLSDQAEVRNFASSFQNRADRLDVLVNNAGVLLKERQTSIDGVEMTFAVNTLGYFLTMALLEPLLRNAPDARVINVSSGGMYLAKLNVDDLEWTERPYHGTKAYAETKRAEAILTRIWAQRLAGAATVNAMHPGWADTKAVRRGLPLFWMMTWPVLRNPAQAADTIVWLAVNPKLTADDSGLFWCDRKPRPFHRRADTRNTDQEIRTFWRYCCDRTDLDLSTEAS